MKPTNYDFSGWATKYNVKCTDSRTIKPGAFAHHDGDTVSLVYHHQQKEPDHLLGHAVLEHREGEGVYAYGYFNDTDNGQHMKKAVKNGDIKALSIWANRLQEDGAYVSHGNIRELSIVMSGANCEAFIDFIAHSEDDNSNGSAIIYMSHADSEITYANGKQEELEVEDKTVEDVYNTLSDEQEEMLNELAHAAQDGEKFISSIEEIDALVHADKTVQDVFDTLDDDQRDLVYLIISEIAGKDLEHTDLEDDSESDEDDSDELLEETADETNLEHSDDEGGQETMKKKLFEQGKDNKPVLSHADVASIFEYAEKKHVKLSDAIIAHVDGTDESSAVRESFLAHAGGKGYGVENIDVLFPEARSLMTTPEFDKRRTEWVVKVLGNCHKVPWSRLKTMYADITADEARAKGYMTGDEKTEEVFPVFKRTTEATTIYKKQKLDRDDIVDITDFNVVMWLKGEMRLMLDEEIARAILIGDGRAADSPDKINEEKIRPIYKDHSKYSIKVQIATDATGLEELESIKRARKNYKGKGNPTLYCTAGQVIDWTLIKDAQERYYFPTAADVAKFLNVKEIIEVEVMENTSRVDGSDTLDLQCIIVNLQDYTIGADKGGNVALFDDFDIDFNQYKYLIETRISGTLAHIYSALVVERVR